MASKLFSLHLPKTKFILNMKQIFTLLALSLMGYTASAQVRNADISVTITDPPNGTVIPGGDTLVLSFNYTNNGPDILPAGDTLFFATTGNLILFSQLTMNLPVGATIAMDDIAYFWNPTNEPISANLCVVHLPQSAIIYQDNTTPVTTYQDPNPNNDTSCVFITLDVENTGIGDLKAQANQFQIFPNPASTTLSVHPIVTNAEVKLSIINSMGQIMDVQTMQTDKDNITLDVSHLANGVYFIRQDAGDKHASARFTIQR